jgi:Tfp pilus assembly protein PilE
MTAIVSNVLTVVASPSYVDLVVVSESASAMRILLSMPSMSSIDFNM